MPLAFSHKLFQNKPVVLGLVIVAMVILLAIFYQAGSAERDNSLAPTASTSPFELVDLNAAKRRQAADYRRLVADRLPIYVDSFPTSVGIDTSINLATSENDPTEVTRLEIRGLSYMNPETDPVKNPNVTAFAESYREAMLLIREAGMDPNQFVFVYADQDYIHTTTLRWLEALNLQP